MMSSNTKLLEVEELDDGRIEICCSEIEHASYTFNLSPAGISQAEEFANTLMEWVNKNKENIS